MQVPLAVANLSLVFLYAQGNWIYFLSQWTAEVMAIRIQPWSDEIFRPVDGDFSVLFMEKLHTLAFHGATTPDDLPRFLSRLKSPLLRTLEVISPRNPAFNHLSLSNLGVQISRQVQNLLFQFDSMYSGVTVEPYIGVFRNVTSLTLSIDLYDKRVNSDYRIDMEAVLIPLASRDAFQQLSEFAVNIGWGYRLNLSWDVLPIDTTAVEPIHRERRATEKLICNFLEAIVQRRSEGGRSVLEKVQLFVEEKNLSRGPLEHGLRWSFGY